MNKITFTIVLTLLSLCASARKAKGFEIHHLTGDFYIYTTWQPIDGKPFPSNGMYIVTAKGIVIVDSPWDSTQVVPILDSIERHHHKKTIAAIATHFHGDRTGAFDIFRRRGISTYSSCQTFALCKEKGNRQAQYCFSADTVFDFGDHTLQTFYPGEGHTRDNIVIWFGKEKILYGGCLIKSKEASTIGYVDDGNIEAYIHTLDNVEKHFPDPAFVIPGHQGWSSTRALDHTRQLVKRYRRKN